MAGLTDEQVAQVRECVERVRAHSKLEPPMFHDLAHDTEPCEEWEEWSRQESELLDEYTDVIHAAVAAAMGNGMDQERFYTLLDVLMAAVAAGLADGNEPLLIRTGKATTMAVRGTTKRGTYDAGDGKPFVRAGDITISADNMGELLVDVGTHKTLAILNHLATTSGYGYEPGRNCEVSTSVADILERRSLEPTRKNKERVRRDIKALAAWSWSWENESTGEYVRVPLAGGVVSIKRGGRIVFNISADFMRYVLNSRSGLLPLDPLLLTTDDIAHPHAYTMGYKLATHSYQNAGEQNQCTLSVEKLLEYTETLPTKDEVKDRNYTRRIIEPMERDLDYLVELGVLKWWDYCHAKGEPLTDREQEARLGDDGEDKALPYDMAIKANIQWQLGTYYEQHMLKTIEARERRRGEALAARERQDRKRKRIERKKEAHKARAEAEAELAAGGESAPSKLQNG